MIIWRVGLRWEFLSKGRLFVLEGFAMRLVHLFRFVDDFLLGVD